MRVEAKEGEEGQTLNLPPPLPEPVNRGPSDTDVNGEMLLTKEFHARRLQNYTLDWSNWASSLLCGWRNSLMPTKNAGPFLPIP